MFNQLRELSFLFFFFRRIHLKENRLHQVYVGVAMRDFTSSMVGVFEPIYLYLFFKDHFAFSSISLVAIYYAIFFFAFGLLSPLGAQLAGRLGFRWMALLAVPFRFLYYFLLIFLPYFPAFLPLALVAFITTAVLYWPAFHFFFAHVSSRETRATSVGLMTISGSLASAVGPAIGGVVLFLFGYPTLFTLVLLLLIASVLPFWFSPDIKEVYRDSIFTSLRRIFRRNVWRPVVAFIASGIEDRTNDLFWPLFLFLLAINYKALGFIMSLSLLITLVATYFVGRLSDRVGLGKMLSCGVVLHFFSWLMRLFVHTPLSAATTHGFFGLSRAVVATPFAAIFYDDVALANGESYSAVILREQALNIGRAIFLVLCAVFFIYSQNFIPLFIIAAIATLLKTVVGKK